MLDENLAALLTETVQYTPKSGLDRWGQDLRGNPITLKCYPAYGARQIQKTDGTIYSSQMALYFDANDETVQGFQLGDKFTTPGIAGGQTLEAQEIAPNYSPGPSLGEPMTAWIVEVYL